MKMVYKEAGKETNHHGQITSVNYKTADQGCIH